MDYTKRIQILNLPETWAKRDRVTSRSFLAMLQSYTSVQLLSVYTSEKCIGNPVEGQRVHCHAFITVNSKADGDLFIEHINSIQVDGDDLQARWSSRALPRTPVTLHQVRRKQGGPAQQ